MNRAPQIRKKAPKGVMKKVLKYLFKSYKKRLMLVFGCIVIVAGTTASISIFLQLIIDNVITPSINSSLVDPMDALLPILITLGTFGVVATVSAFTYSRIMASVTQSFLYDLRIDMFNKMESLPIKYFDQNPHGDIMSTYTNDIDSLRQFISQTIIQLLNTAITVIVIISIMLYYSLWLSICVFLGILVSVNVSRIVSGKMKVYFKAQQESIAHVEGFVEEMMEGQRVVKVFNYEEKSKITFNKLNEKLYSDARNANIQANCLMPMLGNIGNILYIIVVVIGAILVSINVFNPSISSIFTGEFTLSVGVVVSFLTMTKQFAQSIGQLSQQLPMYGMAMAGADRIFKLLEETEEFDEGYVTMVRAKDDGNGNIVQTDDPNDQWYWRHPHKSYDAVTYHKLCGDIVLEHVDFSYVEDKLVLKDVSVYANPGEQIALVGSTGAGKTTITNLINRFYDIADGKVRYDGININKIKKPDLRKSLGMVLQDTNLFTGTVFDNIKYAVNDATKEQVYEAAKLANAYDFIKRLPKGFDTMIENNGSNLSQGQRQLISIARAACANTPVMILDEATSSIDTRTEKLVQKGMDQLMAGRTVFVIAHRLSTVRNSDCIMVLDHGRVIEKGTHESLINNKQTYYRLYTGAFEME